MTDRDAIQRALEDRYAIERELGAGGMATVYLARDVKHDRLVALKVLHSDLAAALGAERFLREIRIVSRLTHPHILPLHDSGEAAGFLYYVMPFVEGESLRDRLARERQLPVRQALRIAREVADALDYAHRRNVVHRDIKPGNILLEEGHAVVADFGIARAIGVAAGEKLTVTGITLGTPLYMSPEQAGGEASLDGRSDVYSLGCVLYEMLAGVPPFDGPTAQAIIGRRLSGPAPSIRPVRQSISSTVERTVLTALAPSPADRFQSASDFSQALDVIGQGSGELAQISGGGGGADVFGSSASGSRQVRLIGYAGAAAALVGIALYVLPRSPPVPARSVAVCPFENLSASDTNGLADGIPRTLVDVLTKEPGLQVPAYTSCRALVGRNLSVQQIGDSLRVATVVQGSVASDGNILRVIVALIDAASGLNLWSQTYNREMTGRFAMQDEITRAIVDTLPLKLAGGKNADKAYDAYREGRLAWNRRTVADLRDAIRHFERARRHDPNYALAYAGLADAYVLLGSAEYAGMAPAEAFPKAKIAALKALAIDETLAEASTSLGNVMANYEWDWPGAELAYRRAIDRNPEYATARQWYATFLMAMGRTQQSLDEIRHAQSLDPSSLIINSAKGRLQYLANQPELAAEEFRKTIAMNPGFISAQLGLALSYARMERYDDAIAQYEKTLKGSRERHTIALSLLGHTYATAGRRPEAMRVLDQLGTLAQQKYVPPEYMAVMYVGLGERSKALDQLELAYKNRSSTMMYLGVEPLFDPLRADPRFKELIRRLRLPSRADTGTIPPTQFEAVTRRLQPAR